MTTREPDGRELVLSGALPQGRVVGDVLVDQAGSKLDYYLDRTLSYAAACDGDSRLSLTLRNAAPAHGLPAYQTPPQFLAQPLVRAERFLATDCTTPA